MRKGFVIAFVGVVAIALAGCSMTAKTVGGRQFPEPSAGFSPNVTYNVDQGKMWVAATSALTANNISMATSSKESGQITTDWLPGQLTSYMHGMGGVSTSRYKYNLFIVPAGKQTRLNVKAVLESSVSGAAGTTGFRDIGDQNPKILEILQDWLYEQVEQKL